MKRIIMAVVLVSMLLPLGGCFIEDREGRHHRDGRYDREERREHEERWDRR